MPVMASRLSILVLFFARAPGECVRLFDEWCARLLHANVLLFDACLARVSMQMCADVKPARRPASGKLVTVWDPRQN